jgi:hypothetical protein
MKYIRKIFESVEEIEEDLRDIFNDYLRDEDDEPDLDSYSGYLEHDSKGFYIIIYGPDSKPIVNDVGDFDQMISMQERHLAFLNKIKSLCVRMKAWGYTWTFQHSDDFSEYYIRVYGKSEFTLEDCFEPHQPANDSLLKRVLKSKYNIDFNKSTFEKGGSGRYSNNTSVILHLRTPISEDNPLFKDLRDLQRKSDRPTHDTQGREMKPIYRNVFSRVRPYHDVSNIPGKYISIKIDF